MKRPRTIIAICFLLVWSLAIDVHRWPYVIRELSRGDPGTPWFDLAAAAMLLLAPLAALPALVGLWRLRRWGIVAYGIWSIIAALQTGLVLFLVAALAEMPWSGWLTIGATWLLATAILSGLWLYVRGVLWAASAQYDSALQS